MQLTGYIVCMHMHVSTKHHRHSSFTCGTSSFISSLFTVGLCIPKGSLQYFLTVVHKNLNTINQLAIVSKQPKNYALRVCMALLLQVQKLYIIIMYLECFHPKLNHDNIIEALMMAITA